MLRSETGLAPAHVDVQQFSGLTARSVNSTPIRLETRGFLRGSPGKARAIELAIDDSRIPSFERPFEVRI